MATTSVRRNAAQMQSGADILVQSLHQSRRRRGFRLSGRGQHAAAPVAHQVQGPIRTVLPRHEQGGGFAAQGYARSTGKPGVCMATSGPGRHESGHRAGRRQAGQHSADRHHRPGGHRGDRHRRLSGNADRRGLPRNHQASLPGDRRQGPARVDARGLSHRHHGPPGSGAGRPAQGRAADADRARLRCADAVARLSCRRATGPARANRPGSGRDQTAPSGR